MKFVNVDETLRNYWVRVYDGAFPAAERKPFTELVDLNQEAAVHMNIIQEAGINLGLAFFYELTPTSIYLVFLAVDPAQRGQGWGSKILTELKRQYPDGIVLESEQTNAGATNEEQRQKRYRFYQRNGFTDSGYLTDLTGMTFHVLTTGQPGLVAGYQAALQKFALPATVTAPKDN
ncbi:hypothetical protein FC56_GL001334 [Lentilactobacillus senioris DSM 24302 = JCM 17472]|uniref:N-acetyltransferase domain-containing protein n=1 Tax=Lentilactobacillus senioris DSM 24302 = JCM 17472 TaxID=1423802 RepID=A0A0R2D2M7_9LACO|nr:GNAT family N-acetyltransferase [Lentilactobacillus senioris]KRM94380.1 hypothetical protein FC56_GL001334 [Lentilactobacillus senioris DSM 24302 = JCM 17472]